MGDMTPEHRAALDALAALPKDEQERRIDAAIARRREARMQPRPRDLFDALNDLKAQGGTCVIGMKGNVALALVEVAHAANLAGHKEFCKSIRGAFRLAGPCDCQHKVALKALADLLGVAP